MLDEWQAKVDKVEQTRQKSIRAEFCIPTEELPPHTQLNVIDVPQKYLSDAEKAITSLGVKQLQAKYLTGELTVVEVVKAFAHAATMAHQLTNCATEFMLDEALEKAAELDAYVKTSGKLAGPLHGIPVSVKEHFEIKGRVTHGALVAFTDHIPDKDAQVVAYLKRAGAVFFVRTNEPQSLMHMDSKNNIAGETVNPNNRNLSSGGSTGGEGALVAMGGSMMGIGSDIGGSIRAPAAFNGRQFALRPTSRRVSNFGTLHVENSGNEGILCVFGPFTKSLDDINLFMKAYLDQQPWKEDQMLFPVPWRDVTVSRDITIGIMMDDGIVLPTPPVTRGLQFARDKLVKAGIKVVEWEPYQCLELFEIINELFSIGGFDAVKALLAKTGETVLPLTEYYFSVGKGEQTVADYYRLVARRDTLRDKYTQLMNERGVDFILSPNHGNVAGLRHDVHYWGYTTLWNILDYPSVTMPTGLYQDPKIDVKPERTPRNAIDAREWTKYVPEKYVGAPLTVQLTGKRYEDETVVEAAKIVYEALTK